MSPVVFRRASLPVLIGLILMPMMTGAQSQQGDELQVGDRAPDFEIPATVPIPAGGTSVRLGAIADAGQAAVLAFFPKAFTGG